MAEFWTVTSLKDFSGFGPLWDILSIMDESHHTNKKRSFSLRNNFFFICKTPITNIFEKKCPFIHIVKCLFEKERNCTFTIHFE